MDQLPLAKLYQSNDISLSPRGFSDILHIPTLLHLGYQRQIDTNLFSSPLSMIPVCNI